MKERNEGEGMGLAFMYLAIPAETRSTIPAMTLVLSRLACAMKSLNFPMS